MTKFYYPKAIPEGTQDLSRGNPVLGQTDPMPSHLPLVFVLAEKGQEEPLLADYARMVNEFGAATFNESGPYFTHQTRLLNIMASNGNAVMIQRVKPQNATTARVRLSVESRVIQTPSGPKTQLIWQTQLANYPTNMRDLGKASEITFTRPQNTSDATVLSQSTLTPVIDFDVRTFGKHGDMTGFSLEPVLEGMGSEEQHINMNAFLYRMRFFTRNNLNVPASPRPSDLGNYYFEGTFSLDSIFPRLSRSAFLGEVIKFEWDQVEGGYQNCPFAEPHIYADEIRALCERLAEGYTVPHKSGVGDVTVVGENTFDAQLPLTIDSRFALGNGVDKAMLLNIFTGVMFDGHTPYHTFVVDKSGALSGEVIGANTIVYAGGGNDGLALLPDGKPNRLENMRILDDYVQTYMNEFGSGQYKLLDMARYPISGVWDTGFSYNTKIAMLTATQRRKDILAFITAFIYADYEMVDDGNGEGNACVPTTFTYTGVNDLLNIPIAPNSRLYFKVQVQVGNSPAAQYELVNGFPDNKGGILFVQLLQAIADMTPVSVIGDVVDVYSNLYGNFNLVPGQNSATIEGMATGEGNDVPATLTFLTPTQAELDDYNNLNEANAIDGALFLFGSHPTWHSCSRILAA